jgi:aspartyl-tRNA(Asn)/glutamyl-tRNA(Gln) amidotransferase subunit B
VSGDWEIVIGLEVHCQLATAEKLFCGCPNRFGQPPNQDTCPVCLGLPGVLPVLNRQAVDFALAVGAALGCTAHPRSVFARKHYFYPDLPKGYQITQYDRPLLTGGAVPVETADGSVRAVPLTRIHLEEDAGKSTHDAADTTLVDLNRAGVPLIEIVGEPALRSAEEAGDYLRALRAIVRYLGVSDGNMEEG